MSGPQDGGNLVVDRLDDRGSFVWRAHPGEWMERASTAVVTDAGVLLVDPVDHPALDERLAALGSVLAVVRLLDRHARDGQALADRHAVPVAGLAAGRPIEAPGVEEHRVRWMPGWHESALWLPGRRLLVCAESLGTARYFLSRDGERLGVHPMLRLFPPRRVLSAFEPAAVAVGHGPPLTAGCEVALREALRTSRRGLTRAWLRVLRGGARPR